MDLRLLLITRPLWLYLALNLTLFKAKLEVSLFSLTLMKREDVDVAKVSIFDSFFYYIYQNILSYRS
jgi:hypothetical protein